MRRKINIFIVNKFIASSIVILKHFPKKKKNTNQKKDVKVILCMFLIINNSYFNINNVSLAVASEKKNSGNLYCAL